MDSWLRTSKQPAPSYGQILLGVLNTSGAETEKGARFSRWTTRGWYARCGRPAGLCSPALKRWRRKWRNSLHSSAASCSRTVCKAYSKGALFRNREQWLLYHAASVARSCPSRQNSDFFLGTSECATSNACTMLAVAPTVDQVAVARAMLSSAGC